MDNLKLSIQPFKFKTIVNIENEIKFIINSFDLYKIIFKPFINLQYLDKLGISNFIIGSDKYFSSERLKFSFYLDEYNLTQSIRRWYHKQNRDMIFNYLTILFNEYNNFLLRLNILMIQDKFVFINIITQIIKFNNLLADKLLILNKTYNDKNIENKIDEFILYLNNFKFKIECLL